MTALNQLLRLRRCAAQEDDGAVVARAVGIEHEKKSGPKRLAWSDYGANLAPDASTAHDAAYCETHPGVAHAPNRRSQAPGLDRRPRGQGSLAVRRPAPPHRRE